MRLPLRDLAAGVICAGFEGDPSSAQFRAALRELPLAGLVFFARNADSVEGARRLSDALREQYGSLPPILAVDQEGGCVARIRRGNTEIPSAMAMAATEEPDLAQRAGEQVAHDLRRAGFNLNFAPVLDLALQPQNTVIGTRSFSARADVVVQFARAFARGLQSGGIVPTFKHFPGHGDTAVDSHLGLPVVQADEKMLRSRDLLPFVALLPQAQAAMSAHVVFTAFDASGPATTSSRIMEGLLRRELGFSGTCFTDCMQMDAIAKTVGTEEGAVAALQAGADCILLSGGLDHARTVAHHIARAVDSRHLLPLRLQEAHARVQLLRRSLMGPLPLDGAPPEPNIGKEIGRRAVRWARGKCLLRASQTCVVSFGPSLIRYAPSVEERRLPVNPPPDQADALLAEIPTLERRIVVLASRAHRYEGQASTIERVLAVCPDAYLVSTLEPFDLERFTQARHSLATFGDGEASMQGLATVLFAE